MKLRRLVEDFRVQELNTLSIGNSGIFAAYELTKSGWTTLDALGHLSRVLNIPRKSFSHAGLKDRHAETRQIITIRHGPRRNWTEDKMSLRYLGQSPSATGSADISGNTFGIVLRSLSATEKSTAEEALPALRQCGLPNYFDDQRFGSWIAGQGFIAEAWIREDYEKALWLTFAEHHPEDDANERQQKTILREHWKDWQTCKRELDRSHRRSIVTFLCDKPEAFKGAWAIVNGDLRGLYLSALQSDLWNQIASDFFRRHCEPEQLFPVQLKTGPVNFPQRNSEAQIRLFRSTEFPLPSARVKLADEPLAEIMSQAIEACGWTFPELKVRFPRDRFFSRSRRPLLLPLDNLTGEFTDDELDAGKEKLTLHFTLPRGSYATMLVKRLSTVLESDITPAEEKDS